MNQFLLKVLNLRVSDVNDANTKYKHDCDYSTRFNIREALKSKSMLQIKRQKHKEMLINQKHSRYYRSLMEYFHKLQCVV